MNPFSLNISSLFNIIDGGSIQSIIGSILSPSYAIRDSSGNIAVDFDSLVAYDYAGSAAITTAPVEQGKYTSINKILQPAKLNVVANLSTASGYSGALPDVQNFKLTTQDQICKKLNQMLESTEIYSIETPKGTFESYDLVGWGYNVSSTNGISLMTFTMQFDKVLQNMKVTLSGAITKETAARNAVTKATQGASKPTVLEKLKSSAGNMESSIGVTTTPPETLIVSAQTTVTKSASQVASANDSNNADVVKRIAGALV